VRRGCRAGGGREQAAALRGSSGTAAGELWRESEASGTWKAGESPTEESVMKPDAGEAAAALTRVSPTLAEDELVEFTRSVARIPSVHGEEGAIAEAFSKRTQGLGIETEVFEVEPNRPNVLGWVRGSGDGPSLMLNGHTDTVLDVLGWTRDPYGGELDGGRIYGHGISNMKASNVAMIYAADAVQRSGVKLKGDLLIALAVGECQGGIGSRDLMKRGIKTSAFVCGEPTYLNVLTTHASAQYFRVNIIGRTGHFGTHDHGLNAILKMYELLRRLGPVHTRLRPGSWIRFRDKPRYRGLPRYHFGTIKGGVSRTLPEHGGWSSTPDFCTAIVNLRAGRDKDIESTREDIERVLHDMQERRGGFQFEVIPIRDMPGFESAADSLAVKAVSEAYGAVVGQKPEVGPIQPYMFMTSDSGHMQSAGMADGVLLGPGNFTSSVPNEHVEVDKLVTAAKIYAVAALRICGYSE